MRTIKWFFWFGFYIFFVSIFYLPKILRLSKKGKQKESEILTAKLVKGFGQRMVKCSGSNLHIRGLENIPKTACLFVGNHQSNFDVPILLGYLDRVPGFVAKIESKKIPLVPKWMELIHCVFMDRDDIRQSLTVMKEASEFLKYGYSMVIFPEGTRSKGEPVKEFKQGSLKIALKSQVPIVPIAINGSYKILEANKGFKVTPADVYITIFEPIYTQALSTDEQKSLAERLYLQIKNEVEKE